MKISKSLLGHMIQSSHAEEQVTERLRAFQTRYPNNSIEVYGDDLFISPEAETPKVDFEAVCFNLAKQEESIIARILNINAPTVPSSDVFAWVNGGKPAPVHLSEKAMLEFADELANEKLITTSLSYRQGVSDLWGMADIARHYYLMPLRKPYVTKTKKGPRHYRAQMVRRYLKETQITGLTVGVPGTVHQATKLPELK